MVPAGGYTHLAGQEGGCYVVTVSHLPLPGLDGCGFAKNLEADCAISPTIRPVVGFRVSGHRRMAHLPDYCMRERSGWKWPRRIIGLQDPVPAIVVSDDQV
jgi:hypothetical protein